MPKLGKTCDESDPFWTPAREQALELVFQDALNDADIAAKVGICRRTLGYWKTHPVFAAAYERRIAAYSEKLRRDAMARYGL